MGKVRSRPPHIAPRIVDIHARNAVGIPAADRPKLGAGAHDREMVADPWHFRSQPPTLAGGVNQDPTRAPTTANDIEPPLVRHHTVAPTRFDHGRGALPRFAARTEPPEVVVRGPILMTEMSSRDIGSPADIEFIAEARGCEVVAGSGQGRSHRPRHPRGIIDLDARLGFEEPGETAQHKETFAVGAGRGAAGSNMANRAGEFASRGRHGRCRGPSFCRAWLWLVAQEPGSSTQRRRNGQSNEQKNYTKR